MTYAEHMRTITAREQVEWEVLDSIDPLFDRADIHAAQICAQIVSIFAKTPPRLEEFILADLIAKSLETGSRQSMEEQKAICRGLHEMFAGRN
jgi:hypothetical protein